MKRIKEIQELSEIIINMLQNTNDTNFNDQVTSINAKIGQFRLLKGGSEPSQDTVIADLTKQIYKAFDNIIRIKNIECQNILIELKKISAQNKINNYRKTHGH